MGYHFQLENKYGKPKENLNLKSCENARNNLCHYINNIKNEFVSCLNVFLNWAKSTIHTLSGNLEDIQNLLSASNQNIKDCNEFICNSIVNIF